MNVDNVVVLRSRDDNIVRLSQTGQFSMTRPARESRMTRTPPQPDRLVARPRRVGSARRLGVVAILATAAVAATAALSAPSVDAARRTSSDAIAVQADRAVDALDEWQATGDPADYVRFVQAREATAELTEYDLEVAAGLLVDEWSGVDLTKQRAVLYAMSQLGVPYRSLTSEPGVGFDCSGLTTWAFAEAGVELPRISGQQIRAAEHVDHDDAEAGDLVYYPGHVSIYLGAEVMVHSPNPGNDVEAAVLPSRSLRFGDAIATADPIVEQPSEPVSIVGSKLDDRYW